MINDLRKRFMGGLAMVVQPDNPEKATEALIGMLPMMDRIPDRAFASREYLEAVVQTKRKTVIPALGEFLLAYGHWLKDHPDTAQLEVGVPEHLTGMDLAWWKYFRLRESEGFGAVQGRPASSREHVLSLVKQQSFPAWLAITGGDRPREDQATREEMSRAAKEAIEALHALPAAVSPRPYHVAPQAAPARPLGALSPEVLAQRRREAGIGSGW